MATWHVWGDYIHTMPQQIGRAQRVSGEDAEARRTAEASGFDFDYRLRNGFEPWAAAFQADEGGADQSFAFTASNTVRGYRRV